MRILVVDDDAETRELLGKAFAQKSHEAECVANAAEALLAADAQTFDVMVLDVMLLGASGIELCKQLRERGDTTPILFLSARGAVAARLEGLDAGADDYLPKPFALSELMARVRVLGRRGPVLHPSRIVAGALSIDFDARLATRKGKELPITAREWSVIEVLARAAGRVVGFDDLLERVWGDVTDDARASLEVIVSRLRRKVGAELIRTVRGQGYALDLQ